jgi:hypothetical protein
VARVSAEKPAPPRIHNESDLTIALGDGYDYPDDFIINVRQEHALASAATQNPGALLCGRVRPTMLVCRDYRVLWEAMEVVVKKRGDMELTVEDVAKAMQVIDPRNYPGDSAYRVALSLFGAPACSPGYVEKCLIVDKLARHNMAHFTSVTSRLNDRAKVEGAAPVYEEYITAAAEIGRTPGGGGTLVSVSEHLKTWDAEEAAARIVPSGIDTVDIVSGGGPGKGDLVVIGGGTNAGKSYFGELLAHTHGAMQQPFAYISVEDPPELMLCRMIARHTKAPQKPVWIRRAPTDPAELSLYNPQVIAEARAKVDANKCVFVDKKRKGRVSDIIDMLRRYRYEKGIVAAMVDYLQAVQPDQEAKGSPNIVQETAKKVSQLKEAADSLGIPIYLTSQLARDEYKNGAEPELTSCKYAGDIENETEILILLWKGPDQLLRAKIAKAKWVETTTPRYIIRREKTTGVFMRWEADFQQPGQGAGAGAGGGYQGGRGRGARGGGRQF